MTLRASLALATAMATASCAAPLLKMPTGPASPAADAAVVLSQALTACQAIKTMTAEVAVSGHVGGRRTRARLQVGLAAPASAYIEAPAPFGAPVFVFAARAEDATLLLPRDQRALEHGRPSAVLEAIAGVPLTPSDLRAALTGCAEDVDARSVQRLDDRWREVRSPSQVVYLHRERDADPWRVVAVVHHDPQPEWRAEYREFTDDVPRTIRLVSSDSHRFDLRLTLSQVEINVALEPDIFRVQIPAGTQPITLEELRDAGPLADRSRKSND
jgi:hypothetical protein